MPRLSKIGAAALAAFGWTSGATVTASYLVVAGGGGGGSFVGGGGGGGGYRTGTASLNPSLSYTVTVGAGGAGAIYTSGQAGNGGNSIFSSITSTGGGGGGNGATGTSSYAYGQNGGSGGGASYDGSTNIGLGNTPSTSPSQGSNGGTGNNGSSNNGGGGGGASAAGTNGASGGSGGAGSASSISGSSVTYAGGGGGAADQSGSAGTGGTGGGGNGGGARGASGTTTAGTANLGGGGGGSPIISGQAGGQGGSGVVIISYAGAQQFGGGVVTSVGGNTIHTFKTSGILTPLSSLSASYLIVAGGAGGAYGRGGGGGAGGLLSGSSLTIDTNSNYLVTVGAGGTGGTSGTPTGANGTNSAFTMVITTAVGGGGGGTPSASGPGVAGGSGGGGGCDATTGYAGGAGTSGQGYAGGQGNPLATVLYGAGGGGGAGAVGSAGTSSVGGNGGVGVALSISGSSTYYAGGGGGGIQNTGTAGSGGNGGGGAGGAGSTAGTSGATNLGAGGGGGGGTSANGGAGGSGIVIISYPGSTQQMAGGTVTIVGGNVIHTFTSSGYLTPIKYVNNSLRFRSSASAYLQRTFSTPTNQTTFTFSCWLKRGKLGVSQTVIGDAGAGFDGVNFSSSDQLIWYVNGSASITTTAVYRDPAAWYHIVLKASGASSVLYVNNQQVGSGSTAAVYFNTAVIHLIGQNASTNYFDGYMTEINLIDGQALTPTSFGGYNSYGVWQPITYGGSYGTNGFYLPFTNNTSTTTLGYDFSPNGNNWTTNNISLTAGVTYDSMTDVPTLTSATASNYAVLNPLVRTTNNSGSISQADGNLLTSIGSYANTALATIGVTSGKWYWEMTPTATNAGAYFYIGVAAQGFNSAAQPNADALQWACYGASGNAMNNSNVAYGSTYTTNDVVGVALDMNAGTLTFYKNGVSQGQAFSNLAGNTIFPMCSFGNSGSITVVANFGQRPFTYTPPTGFVALNTYNL